MTEGKEPSAKRQNAEIKRSKQRLTRWKAQPRASTKHSDALDPSWEESREEAPPASES